MLSIFKRLKNLFFLSSEDSFQPHWEPSELRPSSTSSYSWINQKLEIINQNLKIVTSTINHEEFQTALSKVKLELADIIPYERSITISGPAPSEILKFLQENDYQLKAKFKERLLFYCNFDQMTGHQFEEFCASLLRKNNFQNVTVTPQSGDYGIDITAYKDGRKYAFQCKRYHKNVGNKAVMEAYSGARFYDCQVAVVMTNQSFTQAAKTLAAKNGVLLWDRERLKQLLYNCVK